jgi:hypothetical protein
MQWFVACMCRGSSLGSLSEDVRRARFGLCTSLVCSCLSHARRSALVCSFCDGLGLLRLAEMELVAVAASSVVGGGRERDMDAWCAVVWLPFSVFSPGFLPYISMLGYVGPILPFAHLCCLLSVLLRVPAFYHSFPWPPLAWRLTVSLSGCMWGGLFDPGSRMGRMPSPFPSFFSPCTSRPRHDGLG